MNKFKAKLLKISVAVLVIFTLVTVLIVYAANVNGLYDGPLEWDQGAPIPDPPGDSIAPDRDIVDVYAEYGAPGTSVWFRVDVAGPPPWSGAGGTAVIYVFIDNLPGGCVTNLGGPFDGNPIYDSVIVAVSFGLNTPWPFTDVYNCTSPPSGWTQVGTGITFSMMIVEIEVSQADVQMPPYPMDFFAVYYDPGVGPLDYAPDDPSLYNTLVELSSLSATAADGGVQVAWETASEVDNAGFNLYRADSADGEYVKLNDGLIPAQGGPTQGASYSFLDAGSGGGYYKLEDVDTSGASTFHGPVSAEGGDPNAVGLLSMTASALTSNVPSLWLLPMLVLGAGSLALLWRKRRE